MLGSDPFLSLSQANIVEACARASALQAAGRHDAAIDLWARIVRAAPRSAEAQFNFALSCIALERWREAELAFQRAVALKPDWTDARHRLGNLLHAVGRWDEVEPHYAVAVQRDPENWRARLDLAHLYLGRGNFARGWLLFEARRALGVQHVDTPALPNEWQGEPLTGASVLVWPEQGFGDQIQFARFVPELTARGADVTLVAPTELVALFAGLGVRVVERAAGAEMPAPDYWTCLLSLPNYLGVRLETLSGRPYLSAPPDRRARWAGFAPQGGVGVVWAAQPMPNPQRSMPSRALLQPLADAGARLIDLHPPPGADFADTAAIIEQLDLVVTVDTAVAHVAGALGKPCWVLLPWLNADWKWMQGRAGSPWYDSVRLFRQPAHGDWESVVREVVEAWRASAG
jgi:hypothetical protein